MGKWVLPALYQEVQKVPASWVSPLWKDEPVRSRTRSRLQSALIRGSPDNNSDMPKKASTCRKLKDRSACLNVPLECRWQENHRTKRTGEVCVTADWQDWGVYSASCDFGVKKR